MKIKVRCNENMSVKDTTNSLNLLFWGNQPDKKQAKECDDKHSCMGFHII